MAYRCCHAALSCAHAFVDFVGARNRGHHASSRLGDRPVPGCSYAELYGFRSNIPRNWNSADHPGRSFGRTDFRPTGRSGDRRANAGTLVFGRCARGNRTGTGVHAAASSTGQPASGRAGGRSVCLAAGAATAGSSVCRLSTGSSGRRGGCFTGTECAGCCPPGFGRGRRPETATPLRGRLLGDGNAGTSTDGTGLRGLGSGIRDRAGGCAAGTGGFGSSTRGRGQCNGGGSVRRAKRRGFA